MIPAQAVEAAAKAIYHTSGRSRQMPYSVAKDGCEAEARQALEAAVPYILAEAKAEALVQAADAVMGILPITSDRSRISNFLRACADAERYKAQK